jgi:hypothetical protein
VLFGADWLANLFLGCFLFGLVFTVLSLALGFTDFGGADIPDVDIDLPDGLDHVGGTTRVHHADGGAHHGDLPGADPAFESIGTVSPLNIPTIMATLTWFGGAGYIFRSSLGLDIVLSTLAALASGLAGGWLVFVIISRFLWKGQTRPMRRADHHLPGTHARVISGIGPGGTGEIVFFKSGARRVEGARTLSGLPIERGAEVVITRYEKGLAYVEPAVATLGAPPTTARVAAPPDDHTRRLPEGSSPLPQDASQQ